MSNVVEKVIAVVLVAVAFLFVAYGEFSNSLSGAGFASNAGYANCYDNDPKNDPIVRGIVTYHRLNLQTRAYDPQTPKVDTCIGTTRVQEWSCTSYNKPITVYRRAYCPKGTVCSNGACV